MAPDWAAIRNSSIPEIVVAVVAGGAALAILFQKKPVRQTEVPPSGAKVRKELNLISVGVHGADAKGINVRFDYTPEQIRTRVNELIGLSKRVYDRVAGVPLAEVSYEKVMAPIAKLEAEMVATMQSCIFPAMVSPVKAVRDASTEADKVFDKFTVQTSMREDVYKVVKAYADKKEKLGPEPQRFVDRLIRDFERLGLNLPPETRAEVERLKIRCGEISIMFQKNLTEENALLHFTKAELAGMPDDFIKGLKVDTAGRFEVSLKYPHYFPIMKKCKVGATRRQMEEAFNRRCMDTNTPLLEELVELRAKLANILGYKTHAEYVLAIRMAKSPDKVMSFLEGLSEKISPLAAGELKELQALKKQEEGDNTFGMADFRFYMNKAEELKYNIDHDKLKVYFPMEIVTEGLLKIYQHLLGLKFREVPNPHAWHSDVQLFRVSDAASGTLLGYFYLDLYPRDGKYGHACVCPLQPGCDLEEGTRQLPVAAMLANFTKPTADQPSLLQHSEVETYFHEFGHLMHHLCSYTKLARFAGTKVERDFVEAPSQMLENWCWEEASLRMMSGHYKNKSPLPSDLLQRLMSTKKAHAGLLTKRQLLFGLFDQKIHTQDKVGTAAILKELQPKVMMGIPVTEGTNFAASFGHLAGGYDASYYGYMWSEVFSADMFATKFKKDVLDTRAGAEYRNKILRPGGSKDATDMLRDFLGRDPNDKAFLESKGLAL